MKGYVIIYIDDILIFSVDLEHHHKAVRDVLSILSKNKLTVKPSKCIFKADQVPFLGVIVGKGEVRMDNEKTSAVRTWPAPKTKKQLQAFLGFCNFYRRFIQSYSGIAKPLNNLTGKVEFDWGPLEQNAFDSLKKAL